MELRRLQGFGADGDTGSDLPMATSAKRNHVASHVVALSDGSVDLRPHPVVATNLARLLSDPDATGRVNAPSLPRLCHSIPFVVKGTQSFRHMGRIATFDRATLLLGHPHSTLRVAVPTVSGLRSPLKFFPTVNTHGNSWRSAVLARRVRGADVTVQEFPALLACSARLRSSGLPALPTLFRFGVPRQLFPADHALGHAHSPASKAHFSGFPVGHDRCPTPTAPRGDLRKHSSHVFLSPLL